MKTDSIYGKYSEVLPQVMRTLTDAIIQFNWERVRTNGHPIYEHFNYRVKGEESMREKCTRRDLPQTPESALLELKDSIGLRIITNFIDDIYKTAEFIRELPNVTVITEKDYIKNVKPNGYRSLHIVVDVPVYVSQGKLFIPVEIQIRTVAMDFWATLEHGIRYKAPAEVPPSIVDELRACADVITETDYKMQEIFKALQKVNDMADETPESIMEAERDGKGRRIEQGLGNRD